jgi:hypothetical protein
MTSEAKRTNWSAARAYFLALPPERRTFAEVSRRFQVSDVRVGQVARSQGWVEAAGEIDERVERRAITMLVRNRAERLARTLEVADRYTDLVLGQIPLKADGSVDVAAIPKEALGRIDQVVEKMPGLFKMAELAAGEATDRVAISELQPVLVAFARIAVVNAPAELRGEVIRELEAASAGLVTLGEAA